MVRLIRTCLVAAVLALFPAASTLRSAPQLQATIQAGDIVITGGQLFDGVRDTLVPNTGIIVRHGVFLAVGASLAGRDLGPAQVIRLEANQTVLPGLFDLH